MICKNCGNQLNDNALFCPKCGQKTQDMSAVVQPNSYNTSTAGNVKNEEKPKKRHTVRTVILSVVVTIVVMFSWLIWISSRLPDRQLPDSVETGGSAVSLPQENRETRENVSSQESINELLGYIDQAEELLTKAYNDIEAYGSEEAGRERLEKKADILKNLLSDLSDLQKQANAVSEIDVNLANAGKEYFNMAYDSQNAYLEIMNFLADYFVLYDDILFDRPDMETYTSIADYYYALDEWLKSAKDSYLAIDSCPSCMESEWKKYGDILDLNESILAKVAQTYYNKDYLCWKSAEYMSDRYNIVEELQYSTFISCLKGEVIHFKYQRNLSSKLAEEIHTYAEMDPGKRDAYEFEYVRTNKILTDYEAIDTIYPSLYNTYDAILIIKTGCMSGNRKILVEAEIPGLTQMYKESFTLDSAYRAIYIKPPLLTGDLDLSSAKDAQINVTISEQDGTLIAAKTFPITIKSKYDVEWYTDEYGAATKDNILCFLTPESSAISELKRQAIDEISGMTGGKMESFVGYQPNSWNDHYVGTYLQAAGIMRALYETGVRYNMDSFSISGSNQHILFPEDVLQQNSGLCIETSLTVASALQSAGMHAFLVFPPGHAQVAVEVWNGSGEDKSGTGEYFLIETTELSGDRNNRTIFIENANALLKGTALNSSPIIYMDGEEWNAYLSVEGTYLIDCDDSRVLGLTPFAN